MTNEQWHSERTKVKIHLECLMRVGHLEQNNLFTSKYYESGPFKVFSWDNQKVYILEYRRL